MSDNGSAGEGRGGKVSGEAEAALADRLHRLGMKLDKAQAESQQQAKAEIASSGGMQGVGFALRVSSEFAAGVLVGAGLGWLVDRWLGTSPWGLIVLLLLGFAAGVLNVLRVVGKVAQPEDRVKPRSGK